jgi:hypothetical protein
VSAAEKRDYEDFFRDCQIKLSFDHRYISLVDFGLLRIPDIPVSDTNVHTISQRRSRALRCTFQTRAFSKSTGEERFGEVQSCNWNSIS